MISTSRGRNKFTPTWWFGNRLKAEVGDICHVNLQKSVRKRKYRWLFISGLRAYSWPMLSRPIIKSKWSIIRVNSGGEGEGRGGLASRWREANTKGDSQFSRGSVQGKRRQKSPRRQIQGEGKGGEGRSQTPGQGFSSPSRASKYRDRPRNRRNRSAVHRSCFDNELNIISRRSGLKSSTLQRWSLIITPTVIRVVYTDIVYTEYWRIVKSHQGKLFYSEIIYSVLVDGISTKTF